MHWFLFCFAVLLLLIPFGAYSSHLYKIYNAEPTPSPPHSAEPLAARITPHLHIPTKRNHHHHHHHQIHRRHLFQNPARHDVCCREEKCVSNFPIFFGAQHPNLSNPFQPISSSCAHRFYKCLTYYSMWGWGCRIGTIQCREMGQRKRLHAAFALLLRESEKGCCNSRPKLILCVRFIPRQE